jgi:hypothetical protein
MRQGVTIRAVKKLKTYLKCFGEARGSGFLLKMLLSSRKEKKKKKIIGSQPSFNEGERKHGGKFVRKQ